MIEVNIHLEPVGLQVYNQKRYGLRRYFYNSYNEFVDLRRYYVPLGDMYEIF